MSSRILIVEDEANVRLNYRITLETEGYEVVEAATAASALLLLIEQSFAVAILDMRLPGMDGLELLGVTRQQLADAAQLASLADETPEGRSVVILAKNYGIRARDLGEMANATFVPFTAQTRMSGVDIDGVSYRKGSSDAIRGLVGT
jgi:high-affinity K+ transport system ATPase subunit B